MRSFLLRAWTGPSLTGQVVDLLREAGVEVICGGTEHVYVTSEGSAVDAAAWNVMAALRSRHGKDFGLRWTEPPKWNEWNDCEEGP